MNIHSFAIGVALLGCAVTALSYPKPYAADVSTPELKAALTARLWQHDATDDVRLWPTNRLAAGAAEKPYVFSERELSQSNLVLEKVVNPQFTFFRAQGEGRRPAVVVFPGGGYLRLGWNKEGTEVAEWLNANGFSAAVLLYRAPHQRAARVAG